MAQIHHLPFATLPAVKRSDEIVNSSSPSEAGDAEHQSGITRMRAAAWSRALA